jgi:hypothetical protein
MIEGHEGFRMCGACHEARYCSKACQKSDWKGGHRTACESIRKFRAGMVDLVTTGCEVYLLSFTCI